MPTLGGVFFRTRSPEGSFNVPIPVPPLILLGLAVLFASVTALNAAEPPDRFIRLNEQTKSRMERFPNDTSTKILLETYRPDLFVAPGSYWPMNFYRDYLPRTTLYKDSGQQVQSPPNRALLRKVHRQPRYHLDLEITPRKALELRPDTIHPTLYGQVYGDTLVHNGDTIPLLFLKYSAVFPYSGLPYGSSSWKYYASYLLGNPVAWHEGDIHGAIHVILHRRTREPLGVLLAQHNHHRLYLRRSDFSWPDDNHVDVAYAKFANEPYLVEDRKRPFYPRTIGNPRDLPTLFRRNEYPTLAAGYDKVIPPSAGAKAVDYQIDLLPPDDPLYRSWIPLGDRYSVWGIRNTWYREGPPGMDYYAAPWMKNLADLAAFWSVDSDDDRFFELYRDHPMSLGSKPEPLMRYQREKFYQRLREMIPETN